ncbi:PIR protein [Plasmodium vivax]|uniref:VIR protein n=1 Tax=Plasmodium vivax TaxID=5855 RepID=A0A565A7D0_PLAVI|nr:PIR protein [Plasmodium vivax]
MDGSAEEDYLELFLKDTPTYKLYNNFSRNDIYKEETHFCNNSKKKFNENEKLYNLCKMYEKNLEELLNETNPVIASNKHCRYLTFWINDEIRKVFNSPNFHIPKKNLVLTAFLSVSHRLNEKLSKDYCKYHYNKFITMRKWKEWKNLYDYITNVDEIKKKIDSDNHLCEKYSEYHKYIAEIYRKYKNECCTGTIGNCPDDHLKLNDCCTQGDILTKLECSTSVTDRESSPGTGKDNEIIEGGARREGSVVKAEGEGSADELGPLPVKSQKLQAASEENPEVTPVAKMFKTSEEDFNSESTTFPRIGATSESIMNKDVGTIGATMAGSSLFLVMMYKYTPLGSWINTKILGRNKLMENMRKNNYELLLNDVRNGEMGLNDTTYGISYNSAAK